MSYTLYWDGRTISSYSGTLPASLDLSAVTNPDTSQTALAIGSNCFSGNIDVTSVTFGNDLLNIATGAFDGCTSLNYVLFGNSLSTIEQQAFCNADIFGLEFPNTLTGIGQYAFFSNLISSVIIPNSITNIGIGVFQINSNISSVSIGTGLSTISAGAFAGNTILSLTIPTNITSLEESAFNTNKISNLVIPNTVTNIGPYVFRSNATLSNVSIGTGLNNISAFAFDYCGLLSLTIPSNIITIQNNAFYGNQISSLTIPNSVTSIENSAFASNTTLSSISFGNGLTLIEQSVFNTTNLINLTIPSSITAINAFAFTGNPILTTVTVQNAASNININAQAFDGGVTINYTGGSNLAVPQIFIRPKPYPNSIVYQVNSNTQFTSSIKLVVTGPGATNYSFVPTSNWYRYTVTGLTTSCNYSAYAYQINSSGLSSLTTAYRTVQTGYLPAPVQNLTGAVNGSTATLDWNFSSYDGDATIKWHVIRDLSLNLKYNVLGTISTYTAPLLVNPGINLFSVEAVNDPGYSPRMYWSTLVI